MHPVVVTVLSALITSAIYWVVVTLQDYSSDMQAVKYDMRALQANQQRILDYVLTGERNLYAAMLRHHDVTVVRQGLERIGSGLNENKEVSELPEVETGGQP